MPFDRRQHIIFILSIFITAFLHPVVLAQPLKRLSPVAYNVNEGLLQSQVTDLAEDGNGFIWISSGSGVQRFDGRNFYHIPVTTSGIGIPDDSHVKFFRLQNGNLWLSHQRGLSEYDITTNRFRLIKEIKSEKGIHGKAFAEDENGVWCWFSTKGFYKLNKKTLEYCDSIKNDEQQLITATASSAPLFTGRYALQIRDLAVMITDLNLKKATLINPSSGKRYFYTLEKFKADTVLAATARGIEKIDCRTGTSILIHSYKTKPAPVNHLLPVQLKIVSKTTCLVSEGNKLFELDLHTGSYTAQLINMQNEDFTEVGYTTGIFHDSHSNIWIISENDGIRKVNYQFAGFRYFGTNSRKNNFVKTIYADKKDNRVLCGTFGEGLLIFDSSQHLLKKMQVIPGINGPVTVCGFIKTASHHYLVFVMGTWNIYMLNTLDFTIQKIKTVSGNINYQIEHNRFPDYHLGLHTVNDSVSIIQSGFHINKLTWRASGKLTIQAVDSFSLASVSSLLVNNRLWIGSYGRYYVSEPGFSMFKEFILKENKLVRCFIAGDKDQMWMGTEKGLFLLDNLGAIKKHIGKADGIPDENIYALRKDNRNNLWISHNKGISCRKPDGSFLNFSKYDGLQENEFNTNTSFETSDGELFFGGVNGITSFYPDAITAIKENPQVIITGIRIKDTDLKTDTAYWSIKKIVLPHYSNHISINLAAIGNRTADQYNYQYQLQGQDNEWINAGNNAQIRFALQPGHYVLRYHAGNSFEKDPQHIKQIIIVVRSPFWKTGWFITVTILFLAIGTILITRYTSQRKLKKKIRDLEGKRMVDEERIRISQEMHDDIGAGLTQITLMSEAAKTNAQNKQPLNEIADTSRQLVSSMSEIIWSLNPGNNTLDRLLGYLREELSKLLEYSGGIYEIKFPENGRSVSLNNAQRRNLLLITKEIVHNSIKHSKAKNIRVECHYQKKSISFLITDDGLGFDSSKQFTGNGLRNIHRRVKELKGTLEITSDANKGSRFYYTIPVSEM